ncbi:hypothetical protein SeMB42_g05651 [Synchytrium endobioticum]|uniref:Uncharacterized protein n=1 Tax=Synchytrium endobioticum TaxID=286115 RepID=A0A507CQ48_9FUNG|nr:hypothetical protein SeMB42_g05651 [Synchytrium endobioticum]TPX44749.1 hypothetical protein SeLEV6574_g04319 [Synchytrium endobioticum]
MDEKSAVFISPLDFISGTIGGAAGVLSGHPLDTAKVRIQVDPLKYKTTIQTLRTIVKEERAIGLFKGMTSPLVGAGLINAVLFGVYGTSLRAMAQTPTTPTHPPLLHLFWAGCISGFVNSFISCPMELIKIRLQNQVNDAQYSGNLDCIRKIWKHQGVKGFYRGLGSTLWRETPSYGVYFMSYEYMVRMAGADGPGISWELLVAGGLAGILAWVVTYPFDRLKTLQQSRDTTKPSGIFKGLRIIAQTEGPRGLFAGFGPTALRAFPTNAAIFFAVEATVHLLGPPSQEGKDQEIKEVYRRDGRS